jgi:hypothetical protein
MLERSSRGLSPSTSPQQRSTPKNLHSDEEGSPFFDISLAGLPLFSDTARDATLVTDDSFCSQYGGRAASCVDKHGVDIVHSAECNREWETDWMMRWQVLLEQVKELPLLPVLSPSPSPVDEKEFWAALNPPKSPKFFIHEDGDEFFGPDSDGEDEDYGEVIAQSTYGVTAESLSREFLRNLCNFKVGTGI